MPAVPTSAPSPALPGVIASCAIEPPVHVPQQLQVTRWLGRIGERSYVIARHDQRLQLVSLVDGQLVMTPLGFETLRAESITGTHLWLAGTRDTHAVLQEVELAAPRPRALEPTPLVTAPLSTVDAIAVGGERQLLAERGAKIELQLFDRAGKKLGPVAQITSEAQEMPDLRCTGDRCFAVGIEGSLPDRMVYVERFAPDGRAQHEVLSEDLVATVALASLGTRTIVAWTQINKPGLFMRTLDATGQPLTRLTSIAGMPTSQGGLEFELLPAAPPRIAIRDGGGTWTLGTLDADARRLDEARPLPLPNDATSFTGAVVGDGALGAGFSSRVDYQSGNHSWTAHATAVFVPTTRDAEPPIEVLPATTGEGRGGMAAFPLVEPGHAAVLVLPQGFESPEGGDLIVLRRPCR
jgi:hypothetical protein